MLILLRPLRDTQTQNLSTFLNTQEHKMSPKIEKAGKMKRKSLIEPTNLNNQFSTVRKRLNPNCNMILDAPRPLRFSKRLLETGKMILPACLEPSSASSATDAIQQHDVLPAQTFNSACQGTEIAECSTSSISLKLTEMVAMGENDDDSETQSRAEDNDSEYEVKPEYVGILRKIIAKHGDIAKDCQVKTVKCRSTLLENICEVISTLDKEDFTTLKGVEKMIDLIEDVKVMKVKVDWLLARLTEILEARRAFKEGSRLKETTNNIAGDIENEISELEECEVEKKELSQKLKEICDREAGCKVRLARKHEESTMIAQKVKDATSKVKRFLKCSMIDGLL